MAKLILTLMALVLIVSLVNLMAGLVFGVLVLIAIFGGILVLMAKGY